MSMVYHLPIIASIQTAWHLVKGAKKAVWGALGIIFIVSFLLGFCSYFIKHFFPNLDVPLQIFTNIIALLFQVGLMYLGIQRANQLPIVSRLIFRSFELDILPRLVIAYLLKIFIFLPFILLMVLGSLAFTAETTLLTILFGVIWLIGFIGFIFALARLYLTAAFILDKRFGPWRAITASYRATRSNVLNLIGLGLLQMLIAIIATIPLGIGLIWAVPLGIILYGVVYKQLQVNANSF